MLLLLINSTIYLFFRVLLLLSLISFICIERVFINSLFLCIYFYPLLYAFAGLLPVMNVFCFVLSAFYADNTAAIYV